MAQDLSIAEILTLAPVIPVLTIQDLDTAVPLARTLLRGGLPVIEVTLRTPAALEAIRQIARAVPDAVVGAGTILTPAHYADAAQAGARFCVSPGHTPALLDAVRTGSVPLLPGAATASECMFLLERGYTRQKFFPAVPAGGLALLKSLAAPLADAVFCPTGGIDAQEAPKFLALSNVACVGGSWMMPADALAAHDWKRIEELAAEASSLGKNKLRT